MATGPTPTRRRRERTVTLPPTGARPATTALVVAASPKIPAGIGD